MPGRWRAQLDDAELVKLWFGPAAPRVGDEAVLRSAATVSLDRFLDMMEQYFEQPDDTKRRDVHPELRCALFTQPHRLTFPLQHLCPCMVVCVRVCVGRLVRDGAMAAAMRLVPRRRTLSCRAITVSGCGRSKTRTSRCRCARRSWTPRGASFGASESDPR